MDKIAPGQRKKLEAKIHNAAEMDMGARQDLASRGKGVESVLAEPVERPETPKVIPNFYEYSQLYKAAYEAGMEFEEYCKAGRFVEHSSGKWYRR